MSDLEGKREVPTSEGRELAKTMGITDFYETSAKTGDNVGMLFNTVAQKSYSSYLSQQKSVDVHSTFSSLLPPEPAAKVKKPNCCK